MSIKNDLVGLREQIKENATLVFPDVVEQYIDFHHPQSYNKLEAFDVVTRVSYQMGPRYQAILICKYNSTTITGREETKIAAMGEEVPQVYMALASLLDAVSDLVEGALHDANKDFDQMLRDAGGAKLVNMTLTYANKV